MNSFLFNVQCPITWRIHTIKRASIQSAQVLESQLKRSGLCWQLLGWFMVYSEVVDNGLILPCKRLYTMKDVHRVQVSSLFSDKRGKTITTGEAVFIVKCSAVYHNTEYSKTVRDWHKSTLKTIIGKGWFMETTSCEYQSSSDNFGHDCFSLFNGCDCGGNDCQDRYCFTCNACDYCLDECHADL